MFGALVGIVILGLAAAGWREWLADVRERHPPGLRRAGLYGVALVVTAGLGAVAVGVFLFFASG